MPLFDTHCHLDVAAFANDRAQVIARARAVGVHGFLVPGIQAAGWPSLLALCAGAPDLYPALGLHPLYLPQHRPEHLAQLERLLADEPVVAVGEIGLDAACRERDPEQQRQLFERQLGLAATARLPVVLHVRKAHDQVLACLRRMRLVGGIAHAFNGSLQQGFQYWELGFRLGFGGMLTFDRSRRLHGLARQLPAEALVLETDAPDLTVASHQGERNSPEYLPECLTALARLRDEEPALVAAYTTRNARAALGLGEPPREPI
jgi:TatD DNase family protein